MHYRTNRYVLTRKQTSEKSALMVGSQRKCRREFLTVWQLKRPDGCNCWAGSEVLQEVDGWQNADVAECQHRRPGRSSPTGAVVRGRRMNYHCHCQLDEHPVNDVRLHQAYLNRIISGADMILQGHVSNPSEQGTAEVERQRYRERRDWGGGYAPLRKFLY